MSTKLLRQSPVRVPGVGGLNLESLLAGKTSFEDPARVVGLISVFVSKGIFLCPPNTNLLKSSMRYQWKIETRMEDSDKPNSISSFCRSSRPSTEAGEAPQCIPSHEVPFCEAVLKDFPIQDIWTEISMDLYYQKLPAPPLGGTFSMQSLGESWLPQDKQEKEKDPSTDPNGSGNGSKESLKWEYYGRVVIPLTSFISSFCESRCLLTSEIKGTFWLHVVKDSSDDRKFVKPAPGLAGFGATKPKGLRSPGFLSLQVTIKFPSCTLGSLLATNLRPPNRKWVSARSFEPQYMEAYALRARFAVNAVCRWTPKFFYLSNEGASKRNKSDFLLIGIFHFLLYLTVTQATFVQIPFCLFILVFCVSLTYLYGHHNILPSRYTMIYRLHSKKPAFFHRLDADKSLNGLPSKWIGEDFIGTGGVRIFEPNIPPLKSQSPNRFPFWNETTIKPDEEAPSGTQTTDKEEKTIEQKIQDNDISLWKQPMRTRRIGEDLPKNWEPPPSVVESPLGQLLLQVRDPTSYWHCYSVFSEDGGVTDVQTNIKHGMEMLDQNQIMAGFLADNIEKLKFAFNWEEPLTTVASLIGMFFFVVILTISIFLAQKINFIVFRHLFWLLILFRGMWNDPLVRATRLGQVYEFLENIDPLDPRPEFRYANTTIKEDKKEEKTENTDASFDDLNPDILTRSKSDEVKKVSKAWNNIVRRVRMATGGNEEKKDLAQIEESGISSSPESSDPLNPSLRIVNFGSSLNPADDVILKEGPKPESDGTKSIIRRSLKLLGDCLSYPIFWWQRLPDRREIEHRQIACSQFVCDLKDIVPNGQEVEYLIHQYFRNSMSQNPFAKH
eukprot:GHVP01052577.1.p1 GENE.GHVP01052577.1~~GHVP01052577.1.p1  ORF type:complete len:896 (+),score=159.39 GHVP01052577.1:179-2689(+)